MSLNYIGFTPDSVAATLSSRFFYGFRRTDKGELFFGKVDQLNTSYTYPSGISSDGTE